MLHFVALFADGVLLGVGPDLIGLDAIRTWAVARAAMRERTSRHVCTNLRLLPVSDDEVHGTVILTIYRHDGPDPGDARPFMVGDYDDIYRRGPDGTWRFARRRVVQVRLTGSRRGPIGRAKRQIKAWRSGSDLRITP